LLDENKEEEEEEEEEESLRVKSPKRHLFGGLRLKPQDRRPNTNTQKLARHKEEDVDKDDYDRDVGLTASGAFYLMA
jgi:hypothetical protein